MRMDDCDGVIWFDGEFIPWKDAKVHVLTHTLHYGMGVFEGIRAINHLMELQYFDLKNIPIDYFRQHIY